MKLIRLHDFLSEEEIMLAAQIWRGEWTTDGKTYAQRVADLIIKPNLERINKALGQENDPMYLAYCVEYVLGLALHSPHFSSRSR
jgi:hypothetical protein